MDKDKLKDALSEFKASAEGSSRNRERWVEDVRFARLGEQWTEKSKKQREKEGRPCLTINRLPSMVRQVLNDARQNKPAIKVHPVGSGATRETAEVFNGLIRNIEYTSDADIAHDNALEGAVYGGFGYFRIVTDYADDDAFDLDIKVERIVNPLSVYEDENSTQADSSDWNKAFITELYTVAEFGRRWKGAEKSSWDAAYTDLADGWRDGEYVRVAEYWKRKQVPARILKMSDGMVLSEEKYLELKPVLDQAGIVVSGDRETIRHVVTQCLMSGAETLEENDWPGKYIPIVPVYGDEVNVEGERHFMSLVRWAIDPQKMVNFWRTASTELVALAPKAPFIGPKGAFATDAKKWATANAISHPYIEYDGPTAPQRQPFAGVPAGALQEALNAQDDIKSTMGIYDAAMGARSNETSGRAIIQRQRESDTATFNYIDNLNRAIKHAGRIMVDLIPKVYTVPRIIRMIHEDGTNEEVPVNQQTDYKLQKMQDQAEGIIRIYDLTTGKYDVTCQSGPSYATKRQEAASQMVEMTRAFPPLWQIGGDILTRNLDWPGADELAERMKAMLPPNVQGPNPQVQAMQQQLAQQDAAAREAVQTVQGQAQQLAQQLEQERQQTESIKNDKMLEARKLDIEQQRANTELIKVRAEEARAVEAALKAQMQLMADANKAQEVEEPEAPEIKTITITAPSGNTYTGTIVDGSVNLSGPNGEYQGTMKEGI